MSGELDIHHMAIDAEADLRNSSIERARLRKEGNLASTFQAIDGAPFRTLMLWTTSLTRTLLHRTPAIQQSPSHITNVPIAPHRRRLLTAAYDLP